jgi:hypothetical protein
MAIEWQPVGRVLLYYLAQEDTSAKIARYQRLKNTR